MSPSNGRMQESLWGIVFGFRDRQRKRQIERRKGAQRLEGTFDYFLTISYNHGGKILPYDQRRLIEIGKQGNFTGGHRPSASLLSVSW